MSAPYDYNVINISIASGLSDYELIVDGEKIIYLTGTRTINIKIDTNSNDAIPVEPKMEVTTPFKKLYFSVSAYAETVTFLIAKPQSFSVKSSQVDVDNVNIVSEITNILNVESVDLVDAVSLLSKDISYLERSNVSLNAYRVANNAAFVAGNYAATQLYNPSGSGKNLVLRKCSGYCEDPRDDFRVSTLINARLDTVRSGAALILSGAGIGKCNVLNGNSVAEIWAYNGVLTTWAPTYFMYGGSANGFVLDVDFKNPVIIPPGYGIVIDVSGGNSNDGPVAHTFEFEELTV